MKKKKIINQLIKSTPSKIRAPLIRSMYKYQFSDADNFEFRLAETYEDKIEASKIVQENYVKSGLSIQEAELRISKYSLLPSTYVFIARHKITGEIVATMSLIIHTSLGLPIEEYVEISKQLADGKRAAELSSFSVKPEYRSHSNGLSIILMFYTMMYAYRVLGMQHTFISVRKSVEYFYRDMFFFSPIGEAINYSTVNNVVGIPMYMNFPEALIKMKRSYNHRKMVKNVYKQLIMFPWKDQCDFSQSKYSLVSRFYYRQDEINELLSNNNFDVNSMTERQKVTLESIYFNKIFALKDDSNISSISLRQSPRFLTLHNAIGSQGDGSFQLEIQEVSANGLMVRSAKPVDTNSNMQLKLQINAKQINIDSKVAWQTGNLVGLQIVSGSDSKQWTEMLHEFDSYLHEQVKMVS